MKDGEKPALTTWEPFYKGRPTVDESVNDRGKFIALTKLALAGDLEAVKLVSAHARSFDALLTKHPDDIPALEARAYGLGFQNRVNEAITAFEHVLAIRPRWETSLSGMASVAEEAGKLEFAIEHWRKATEVNPRSSEFRRRLTNLLLKADAYEGALSEANSWITIDPFSIDARSARVQALLALGRHRDARSEFATVEKLEPANLRELRIRFERRLKQ